VTSEEWSPGPSEEVEEGLTIKGDLQESSLPDLLRSLSTNNETGVLTLSRGGHDKSIHLRDGRIVFATSTDPDDRLGETLLRYGKIGLAEYLESAKHIRPGKRQGAVLVELGYLSPEDLVNAVQEQVEEIIYSLFGWTMGKYKLLLQELDTQDLVTLILSTEKLIYEGVRRIERWSRIFRGIGSSMVTVLEKTAEAEGILYNLDLTEDESHLVSLVNGKLTVEQICTMSYLSNFETCRALYGLLAVGAFVISGSPEARAVKGKAGQLDDRLRKVLARYEDALETIRQELEGQAEPDAVDTFLQGSLRQIQGQYPAVLSGVRIRGGKLEEDSLLRNVAALPQEEREELTSEALSELLYATLLRVKVKFGVETEKRLSDQVTQVLREE
jgi:hypothetical protein